MNLWTELYLGIVIGLSWSFKSLLSRLPCNKVPFFCNGLALYYTLGGFSYGKVKLAIGFLTFLAFKKSDQLLEVMWEPCSRLANGAMSLAVCLLSSLTQSALPSPRRQVPHHGRHSAAAQHW